MARAAAASLALAVALGCGGTSTTAPPPAQPAIDHVDGAVEPILTAGASIVIDGFGFGDAQGAGAVRFPKLGGGEVVAPLSSEAWSDRAIRAVVPDSATTGDLVVTTDQGLRLTAPIHVLPRVPFDPASLTWLSRSPFPRAPVGVALAVSAEPAGAQLAVTLWAAGGAEPVGGDSALIVDSGVYVAAAAPGGATTGWTRQTDTSSLAKSRVLPAPRAYAAAAVATRFNSPFIGAGGVLYVVGGVDAAGRAQPTVFGALTTSAGVSGPFTPLTPLPVPVSGAIAVMRRGRLYILGGADSIGRPQPAVYLARVRADGTLDGWYAQPPLPGPRALGGGVVLEERVAVFGGIADSAPVGGGLSATPARLADADTAGVSLTSGFFTAAWGNAGALLPEGRSQFATLYAGTTLLAVGGYYGGAPANAAETLASSLQGDTLGGFAGPVGTNTIAGQGGGTLVGPSGASWQDGDGTWHGIVLGGLDLLTRERRADAWGF